MKVFIVQVLIFYGTTFLASKNIAVFSSEEKARNFIEQSPEMKDYKYLITSIQLDEVDSDWILSQIAREKCGMGHK